MTRFFFRRPLAGETNSPKKELVVSGRYWFSDPRRPTTRRQCDPTVGARTHLHLVHGWRFQRRLAKHLRAWARTHGGIMRACMNAHAHAHMHERTQHSQHACERTHPWTHGARMHALSLLPHRCGAPRTCTTTTTNTHRWGKCACIRHVHAYGKEAVKECSVLLTRESPCEQSARLIGSYKFGIPS
jgi:hypothetical protein